MKTIKSQNRDEWLRERSHGIGSSDAAMVMGASRFGGPLTVWMDKTGRSAPTVDNRFLKAGRYMQHGIMLWFADEIDCHVEDWPEFTIAAHDEYDFIRATPDAIASIDDQSAERILGPGHVGGLYLVEIKTTSAYRAEDWEHGNVPEYYRIQCLHQMMVLGPAVVGTFLVVLIGGNDLRWHYIERDTEYMEKMLHQEKEFWTKYVQTDERPPNANAADHSAIATLNPEEDGSEVALEAEYADMDDEIQQATRQIKVLQERVADLKARITARIGTASAGVLPNGVKYTYKTIHKKGYVKEVQPQAYRILRRYKAKE